MQIVSSGESSYLRKVLCLKQEAQYIFGLHLNEHIRQMLVKIMLFVYSNNVEYGYVVDYKSKYCDPSQLCSVSKTM